MLFLAYITKMGNQNEPKELKMKRIDHDDLSAQDLIDIDEKSLQELERQRKENIKRGER